MTFSWPCLKINVICDRLVVLLFFIVGMIFNNKMIMRRFFPCVFSDSVDNCKHRQNLYQLNENVYLHTDDQYVIESLRHPNSSPHKSPKCLENNQSILIDVFCRKKMRVLFYRINMNKMLELYLSMFNGNRTVIYNLFLRYQKKRKCVKPDGLVNYRGIFPIRCFLQIMVLEEGMLLTSVASKYNDRRAW